MAYTLKINLTRIEINLILIKPKLKSTLKLNPISLLPLHHSCLSPSLCILAAFTLYHENTSNEKMDAFNNQEKLPPCFILKFQIPSVMCNPKSQWFEL